MLMREHDRRHHAGEGRQQPERHVAGLVVDLRADPEPAGRLGAPERRQTSVSSTRIAAARMLSILRRDGGASPGLRSR